MGTNDSMTLQGKRQVFNDNLNKSNISLQLIFNEGNAFHTVRPSVMGGALGAAGASIAAGSVAS